MPLAQAKNGDKQFWKEKFHAANVKAWHALMNIPVFFFLKGGGDKSFFFAPLFPICSHQVPKWFPSSQSVPSCIPQDVPNSTCVLSHMVYPKFNFPVYKL